MADNLNIRRPEDALKINVNESYEVRYWCAALQVTEQQLRAAVRTAGPWVKDVRRALGR